MMYFLLLAVPFVLFLIWKNNKPAPDPRFKDVKSPGTSPDGLERPKQTKDTKIR